MAGYQKRSKDYPEPQGKLVKFYLERTQYMDRNRTYILPVEINGYKKTFEFGKSHEVPEEWVKAIEQAKSALVRSSAIDRFESGWKGRPQSDYAAPDHTYEYVPDYGVVREREA